MGGGQLDHFQLADFVLCVILYGQGGDSSGQVPRDLAVIQGCCELLKASGFLYLSEPTASFDERRCEPISFSLSSRGEFLQDLKCQCYSSRDNDLITSLESSMIFFFFW